MLVLGRPWERRVIFPAGEATVPDTFELHNPTSAHDPLALALQDAKLQGL
jgi:hypothetical protein